MYVAQRATQEKRAEVKKARLATGALTLGERLGIMGRRLGKESVSAYKAMRKQVRAESKTVRKAVKTKAKPKSRSRKSNSRR